MFTITLISSADKNERTTASLPPIEYESIQSNIDCTPPRKKRVIPKGKSGIPVYAGHRAVSRMSHPNQNNRNVLKRGNSYDKVDRDDRHYNTRNDRYRNSGNISRAGNHSRLSRAYSDNNITRLPPISPRKRVP